MNTVGEQIVIASGCGGEKIILQVREHYVEIMHAEDLSEHQQKYTRRFMLDKELFEFVRDLIAYGTCGNIEIEK